MLLIVCVTTINAPTKAMHKWAKIGMFRDDDYALVVAGDERTPDDEWYAFMDHYNAEAGRKIVQYLSLAEQKNRWPRLHERVPVGHYGRKNFAYLYAMQQRADWILETDDDNEPMFDSFWPPNISSYTRPGYWTPPPSDSIEDQPADVFSSARIIPDYRGWVNAYSNTYWATSAKHGLEYWPRGFPHNVPLYECSPPYERVEQHEARVLIFQFLHYGEPDLDAFQRLMMPPGFEFRRYFNTPLLLGPHQFAPFNSQSTLWHHDAFPLMYMPCRCTHRETDILRSYVVRAMMNGPIAYATPIVHQERNPHDLKADFKQEVRLYSHANAIMRDLKEMADVIRGKCDLMKLHMRIIERLHDNIDLPEYAEREMYQELDALRAWWEEIIIGKE